MQIDILWIKSSVNMYTCIHGTGLYLHKWDLDFHKNYPLLKPDVDYFVMKNKQPKKHTF
jgi:hypothetical protein